MNNQTCNCGNSGFEPFHEMGCPLSIPMTPETPNPKSEVPTPLTDAVLESNRSKSGYIRPTWAEAYDKLAKHAASLEHKLAAAQAWQDIATIPKETPVQVMTKKYGAVTARQHSGYRGPSTIPGDYPVYATHWRALPQPPTPSTP